MNRTAFMISFLLFANSLVFLVFSSTIQVQTKYVLVNLGFELIGVALALTVAEWSQKRKISS